MLKTLDRRTPDRGGAHRIGVAIISINYRAILPVLGSSLKMDLLGSHISFDPNDDIRVSKTRAPVLPLSLLGRPPSRPTGVPLDPSILHALREAPDGGCGQGATIPQSICETPHRKAQKGVTKIPRKQGGCRSEGGISSGAGWMPSEFSSVPFQSLKALPTCARSAHSPPFCATSPATE